MDLDELAVAVEGLVAREAAILSAPTRERIVELILRDTVGLGPLEELMADPMVEEVMVNGPEEVYVERGEGSSAPRSASRPSARCATRSSEY